jgi:hypothetical protein
MKNNCPTFLVNKYTRWYLDLVSSRQNRIKNENEYYENHHIIPKSLGGANNTENLVLLTAKEHFLAHWLLTKCVDTHHTFKMLKALHKMTQSSENHKRIIASWQYEVARKANRLAQSGKKMSEANKQKLIEAHTGKKRSQESRMKMSLAAKGKPKAKWTEERKAERRGKKHSIETCKKKSEALKGKPKSETAKLNMKLAWTKRKEQK